MSGPLVSVLTPSYNQARWLAENLGSVACQTYPAIEHLVMDGGSADGSVELLQQTDGVTWASEPDEGQSHALNKAFAASTGEIVGWLNSDDAFWDCRVVADVVAFFAEHPDVDVVFGHAAHVNEDGLLLHFFRVPPYGTGSLLRRYDYIVQPAVFVRRRVLAETLVDESYHFTMDYELWLRLAASGARFARIDRVLAIDPDDLLLGRVDAARQHARLGRRAVSRRTHHAPPAHRRRERLQQRPPAIVLPDEQLLLPTLYAIPESISTINVTMGYPLASSPIAGLMEHLFAMQENWRMVRKQPAFYYRFLLPVLNHRYITNLAPEACEKIYQNILTFNRIFIETSDFEKHPLLSKIFKPVKSGDDIAAYLMEVLEQIQKHYKAQYDENDE